MILFKRSPTVLCAVCGTEREIPKQKKNWPGLMVKSAAWALLCGVVGYLAGGMIPAAVVALLSGVLCFLSLEVYDSVKFKRELVCPVCQFDPLLYRRSPEQAKQRCLENLKEREELLVRKWQFANRLGGENYEKAD
jgi:hypothetical protein